MTTNNYSKSQKLLPFSLFQGLFVQKHLLVGRTLLLFMGLLLRQKAVRTLPLLLTLLVGNALQAQNPLWVIKDYTNLGYFANTATYPWTWTNLATLMVVITTPLRPFKAIKGLYSTNPRGFFTLSIRQRGQQRQ